MANLQQIIFKVKELLSGNKIILNLEEIRSHFEGNTSVDSLDKLLQHAVSTTIFYKELDKKSFEDFPIINKNKIKEHYSDFQSSAFLGKSLIQMTTSGSTGTPFTVFQNVEKKQKNLADTLYFSNLAGYKLGNRLIYFRLWDKSKMAPKYHYWLQNIIPFNVFKLDDTTIQHFIDEVENNDKHNYSILGFVSAYESIIRYCEKMNKNTINANFESIITMSESLNTYTKEKLSVLFNCPVVSRYSNLENGIMAQQLIHEERFLINTSSYRIEILDFESDKIVKYGEKGRIVVTDLFNYAMPLIRYDTGDIGSMIVEDGKSYLSTVEGRKFDLLFDTNGHLVSSIVVAKIMVYYNEIKQYQLIQTSQKDYIIKINCDEIFVDKENQLVSEFKSYLGNDAIFTIEYVNEIPLLNSGKRREVINLYKNTI